MLAVIVFTYIPYILKYDSFTVNLQERQLNKAIGFLCEHSKNLKNTVKDIVIMAVKAH